MAAICSKFALFRFKNVKYATTIQKCSYFNFRISSIKKMSLLTASSIAISGVSGLIVSLYGFINADDHVHPPKFPWNHNGWLSTYDHQSIRRGYKVYRDVCSACHSIKYLRYRELVGVSHTTEEARIEANKARIIDGPNDEGDMFLRPGKLYDSPPSPYVNEEKARVANSGALPPDLSLIVHARHNGENYIFSLLTGYCDPPAGIEVAENLYYNPYFPGGSIGMAPALYNEIIEYSDGTPATLSQLAKDVATFLKWVGEPEHDIKKKIYLKSMVILSILYGVALYYKRLKWSSIKTRKIIFKPKQ